MDSTAASIALPLAAAGISAYAPRRGGAAVQAGLGTMGAIQDYNLNKQHGLDLQQEHELRQAAENRAAGVYTHEQKGWSYEDQLRDSALKQFQGWTGAANGTGGTAPAAQGADMITSVKTGDTNVAKPSNPFHLDPQESMYAQALMLRDPLAFFQYTDKLQKEPTLEQARTTQGGLGPGQHVNYQLRGGGEFTGTGEEPELASPADVPTPAPGQTIEAKVKGGLRVSKHGREPLPLHFNTKALETDDGVHIVEEGVDPFTGTLKSRRDMGSAASRAGGEELPGSVVSKLMAQNMVKTNPDDPAETPHLDEAGFARDMKATADDMRAKGLLKGQQGQGKPDLSQPLGEGDVLQTKKGNFVRDSSVAGGWRKVSP